MPSLSYLHRRRRDEQLLRRLEHNAGLDHGIEGIALAASRVNAPVTSDSLDEQTLEELLDLHFLSKEFQSLKAGFRPHLSRLVFCETLYNGPIQPRPIHHIATFNSGQLALDLHHADNSTFLLHESYVFRTLGELEHPVPSAHERSRQLHAELVDLLYKEVEWLEILKAEEWKRRQTRPPRGNNRFIETESLFSRLHLQPESAAQRLARCCKVIALIFHLIFGLSERPTRLLLAALRSIVHLTLKLNPELEESSRTATRPDPPSVPTVPIISSLPSDPSSLVPKDIEALVKNFRLDPTVLTFICCPRCFALYAVNKDAPTLCTFRATPGSGECGAKLFRTRTIRSKIHHQPVLQYHHQTMRGWIARLLARPGIEDHLEAAKPPVDVPDVASDFWDGTAIRNFCGPAGYTTPYMDTKDAPPNTLRLVFSLCSDGFNPFQSKAGKGSVTSTGIYMVCLNLPPHLRYLPENVYFVGIIPGNPSKEQMNHFTRLIVEELLPFWDSGLFFSRTAKYEGGRWVNAALIPVVADLPASRQLGGFGSHNMRFFCNSCYLTLDDMESFDVASWPPRTLAEHLSVAQQWRDAQTTAERETLFNRTGIRWTEFLRLPYWNPLTFLLLESMHNHYLGLLEEHCREAWGMSRSVPDGDGRSHPTKGPPPFPSKQAMQLGKWCILHGTDAQVYEYCSKPVLWYLCAERGLRRASTISKMVAELKQWRSREGFPVPAPAQPVDDTGLGPQPGDKRRRAKKRASGRLAVVSVPVEVGAPSASTHISQTASAPTEHTHAVTGQDLPVPHDLPFTHHGQDAIQDFQSPALLPSLRPFTVEELPEEKRPFTTFIIQGERILASGLSKGSLRMCGSNALRYMCERRGLSTKGGVAQLVDRLFDYTTAPAAASPPGDLHSQVMTPVAPEEEDRDASMSEAADSSRRDATDLATPTDPTTSRQQYATSSVPIPDALIEASASIRTEELQRNLELLEKSRGTNVLGASTLSLVHSIASRTILPSWISPAPTGFGTATRGKLSADQYRTICSVHLPIALIPHWTNNPDCRMQDMLRNFMNLVSAVNIGGQLQISTDDIQLYDKYILKYLPEYKRLYQETTIKSNHHLAVHLSQFLRSFGPVHSWRAFAFERINYLLQRLNTNMRVGDLEATFLFQVCRAANLRPILQDLDVRADMPELFDLFDRLQHEDQRGTRISETLQASRTASSGRTSTIRSSSDVVPLSREAYEAVVARLNLEDRSDCCLSRYNFRQVTPREDQYFLSRKAILSNGVFIQGVTYRPSNRDGNLLFRVSTDIFAAQLLHIVSYSQSEPSHQDDVFLIVKRQAPLDADDARHDCYKPYGASGGFLCYNETLEDAEAIRPAQVVCHFAKTVMTIDKIKRECIHVLPLNRLVHTAIFYPPEDPDTMEDDSF